MNFSKTLHQKLKRWGFETSYVQYFPKPGDFLPGADDELFFWQRITGININTLATLLDKYQAKIHIHKSIDPGHTFTEPTESEQKKYQVTFSDWFETREEMQEMIKSRGLFIAPRVYEGIGLSFLEAMAMGKAVIAANNPTMNEYISHGETGYLFDVNKPTKIDLSGIKVVQKKTYEYMVCGYQNWEVRKRDIIDFVEAD